MTLDFAQNVPATYGAGIGSSGDSTPGTGALLSWQAPNLREVIQGYRSNTNMSMDHPECGESCSTTVNVSLQCFILFFYRGFGIFLSCMRANHSSNTDFAFLLGLWTWRQLYPAKEQRN
jgi:hypothetical protein